VRKPLCHKIGSGYFQSTTAFLKNTTTAIKQKQKYFAQFQGQEFKSAADINISH
jgi:hypothetical protein